MPVLKIFWRPHLPSMLQICHRMNAKCFQKMLMKYCVITSGVDVIEMVPSVSPFVWVFESYVVHYLDSTGLRCPRVKLLSSGCLTCEMDRPVVVGCKPTCSVPKWLKGYMTPLAFWHRWMADLVRNRLWKFEAILNIQGLLMKSWAI